MTCFGLFAGFLRKSIQKKVDALEVSDETSEYVNKLECTVTKMIVATKPDSYIAINENPRDHTDLKTENLTLGWKKGFFSRQWKKSGLGFRTAPISKSFTTYLLEYSDLNSDDRKDFIQQKGAMLRADDVFPLTDDIVYFDDDEQALRVMDNLKIVQGKALPESYNTGFDMQSDASFSRIFFNGLGAVLMAHSDVPSDTTYGPYVVDLPFHGLKVRDERFKGFGVRIHFDKNQMPTAIYDYTESKLIKPGDADWAAAKMHAKVTTFSVVTVREHLTWSHLIVSNDASREIVLELHPEHPIRRLLAIFTFNAVNVNRNAFEGLVPNMSLVHRALPLEYEGGVVEVFENGYTTSIAYQPFNKREIKNPAVRKLSAEGKFPYHSEGCEYYEIVREFVGEWLKNAGDEATDEYAQNFYNAMQKSSKGQLYELPPFDSPDAMVDLISTIIFTVTGFHEIIGHVIDYTEVPSRAGFRLTKEMSIDKPKVDMQSYFIGAIITGSTSVKMPMLMREFPNFIGAGGAPAWERPLWDAFRVKLGAQSETVKSRAETRAVEFKYFDPELFECSISV